MIQIGLILVALGICLIGSGMEYQLNQKQNITKDGFNYVILDDAYRLEHWAVPGGSFDDGSGEPVRMLVVKPNKLITEQEPKNNER